MHAVVADDDRAATAILAKALQRWGVEVTVVHDGDAAWQAVTSGTPPDLAIVDWMMPGLDGIELCRRIRAETSLASLYVILLTGRATRSDLVAGLDAGADDYMVKPIDAEELRARVQVATRVATLQRRLNERVSELQLARDHLARLASTDALTGVYSRGWWFELATNEFARNRRADRAFSLVAIDIDFFKKVNDTHGHDTGDRVLQRFAEMVRHECRQSDIVGRLGGEEFALLLPETSLPAAEATARRIIEACRALVIPSKAASVRFTCSIGISEVQRDDQSLEDVMSRADFALYDAKRSGRDCWKSAAVSRPSEPPAKNPDAVLDAHASPVSDEPLSVTPSPSDDATAAA
jgi:two-component system cell cycle response regulator